MTNTEGAEKSSVVRDIAPLEKIVGVFDLEVV